MDILAAPSGPLTSLHLLILAGAAFRHNLLVVVRVIAVLLLAAALYTSLCSRNMGAAVALHVASSAMYNVVVNDRPLALGLRAAA